MNQRDPNAFRPIKPVGDASERHKRWLAMMSDADWTRIRALSRQVNDAYAPGPLVDLSAPLRVACCPAGQEARFPGECIGTLRGGRVAVVVREETQQEA